MTVARDRYGLLGDPVTHSVSPALYGAVFRLLGIGARYETQRVPEGDAPALWRAMREFAASGGGNVTIPHKVEAVAALEVRLAAVETTGACNCFWLDERGRLTGDNTDVVGFLSACAEFAEARLTGASVLLLGAGGAARAVAAACVEAGVASLDIRNRTAERARGMVRELRLEKHAAVVTGSPDSGKRYDLIVNATRLGLSVEDPLPMPLDARRCGAVFDLVYGTDGTAWTRRAAELGIPATDGRRMLVHQAMASFERWRIEVPDREKALRTMLQAADTRLAAGASTGLHSDAV